MPALRTRPRHGHVEPLEKDCATLCCASPAGAGARRPHAKGWRCGGGGVRSGLENAPPDAPPPFPRLVDSQCRRSRSSQQTKPEAAHFFCMAHLILKHRHADRWPMTMRPKVSRLPLARPSPEALSSWRPTATPASCAKVVYQCVGLDRVLDRGRRSQASSDAG